MICIYIIISTKEIMFLVVFVCLSVFLFINNKHYSKRYKQSAMKFYREAFGGKRNEWLDCGWDPDHDPALMELRSASACNMTVCH